MVLKNNLIYEPSINKIEKEEDVIRLLTEVRDDINNITSPRTFHSLQKSLEIINATNYEYKDNSTSICNSIDLSKAQDLIRNYRYNSEGGCQSCKHEKSYMPLQDEHVLFCSLYEYADVVDSGSSPRIAKYSKTGCGDKKPIFSKTIEKILEEHK